MDACHFSQAAKLIELVTNLQDNWSSTSPIILEVNRLSGNLVEAIDI